MVSGRIVSEGGGGLTSWAQPSYFQKCTLNYNKTFTSGPQLKTASVPIRVFDSTSGIYIYINTNKNPLGSLYIHWKEVIRCKYVTEIKVSKLQKEYTRIFISDQVLNSLVVAVPLSPPFSIVHRPIVGRRQRDSYKFLLFVTHIYLNQDFLSVLLFYFYLFIENPCLCWRE